MSEVTQILRAVRDGRPSPRHHAPRKTSTEGWQWNVQVVQVIVARTGKIPQSKSIHGPMPDPCWIAVAPLRKGQV